MKNVYWLQTACVAWPCAQFNIVNFAENTFHCIARMLRHKRHADT